MKILWVVVAPLLWLTSVWWNCCTTACLPTCAKFVLGVVAKADWLVDIYVRTFLCCDWTILTHAPSRTLGDSRVYKLFKKCRKYSSSIDYRTLFEKSDFVQKIPFWQNFTIFIGKSKLSTTKKCKSPTFHEFFTQFFLGKSMLNFWTKAKEKINYCASSIHFILLNKRGQKCSMGNSSVF